jgi:hypothetical protein
MALGITMRGHNVVGNRRQTIATIAFDSSYPTGGEPLTARNIGLGIVDSVEIPSAAGYLFEYDYTNSKVKVFYPRPAYTPGGTVTAPVFTGTAIVDHTHTENTAAAYTQNATTVGAGAHTPAGTNSAPAFTGTASSASVAAEVPDATDLSALTNVRVTAIGC